MSEQGREDRYHAEHFVGIYGTETGGLIGCLLDLSVKGMRLICQDEIIVNELHKLTIDIPRCVSKIGRIKVKAICVWCSKEDQHYSAGFKFEDIDPKSIKAIENLLHEWEIRRECRENRKEIINQIGNN
jgi:hypothetical protein